MLGTIDGLILGVILFVGGHFVLSSRPIRDPLAESVGEQRFLALYSVLMLAALVWTILAYGAAPFLPVWEPGPLTRWVPNILMPFAVITLVAGLTTRSPTAVGGETVAREPNAVKGILTITRHPFLWGVGLWGVGHLAANGDLASIVLFGGVTVLAFAGMPALDAKMHRKMEAAWGPIVLTTSILPFRAVIERRVVLDLAGIGWWRVLLGLAVWAALYGGHAFYAGVWPHPGF